MPTPSLSGTEGKVGAALQTGKGVAATAFLNFKLADFTVGLQVTESESESEIGGAGLDESPPERYGHEGAPYNGEGRMRTNNLGIVFPTSGLQDKSGGIRIWTGVNDIIRVTDDGGGPVNVNLLTGTGSTISSGDLLTPAEFAANLKAVLDADTTLTQTYTVAYSSSTKKFTISHAGTTLSLHWSTATDIEVQMLGNLMGYDISGDDTGSVSYEGDYARDYRGRWVFINGEIDVMVVTDDGGQSSVDILSGTGAVLDEGCGYNAWQVCAGLKAVFEGDATLTEDYLITFDEATNKFTISNESGSTLQLNLNNASNNIDTELGYTATDHTGALYYTSDSAILPAAKHSFAPYESTDDFPYGSFLDQLATDEFATLVTDCRTNSLEFDCAERSPVRLSFSGRGLDRGDPGGSETETEDTARLSTPHTAAGHVRFFGTAGTPESYRALSLNLAINWEEVIEGQLASAEPYNITPSSRTFTGTLGVGLGAEDDGGVVRACFYGADDGTDPSTTVVQRIMDVQFDSGQLVPNQVGSTEKYGIRWFIPETWLTNFTLNRMGGFEQGTMDLKVTREDQDWYIILINDAADDLYKVPAA